MKICPNCGYSYDESLAQCPCCNSPNEQPNGAYPNQPYQQSYPQYPQYQQPGAQYPQYPQNQQYQQPVQNSFGETPQPDMSQTFQTPQLVDSVQDNAADEKGKKPKKAKKTKKLKEPKKPLTPEEKKKRKKRGSITAGVIAAVLVIAVVVTSVINVSHSKPFSVTANTNGEATNSLEFSDKTTVIKSDKSLEKGFEDVLYNEEKDEYQLFYKELPEAYSKLKKGSIFVVPCDKKAKNEYFRIGFSGKVTKLENNCITFKIPEFKEVFKSFRLDTREATADSVTFIPESGVEVDSLTPNTASAGFNNAKKDGLTIGDFTGEVEYYESNKQSQLKGYDIVAKKLGLKISKKSKLDDTKALEYSGSVTFDYPAIKYCLDYDGEKVNKYDLGFISKETVKLKIKGTSELGLDDIQGAFSTPHVIDLKDASEFEKGKISIGVFSVGYFVPVYGNIITGADEIGVGLTFDVGITANGKIEIECEAKQSGFMRVEANSKGKSVCELLDKEYPNPVLGEELLEGDKETYGESSFDYSVHGNMEFKAGISIDFCVSILGTVPCKLAASIFEFNTVADFDSENYDGYVTKLVKDTKLRDLVGISFYQLKSEARIIFNIGAKIDDKFFGTGVKTSGFSAGGALTIWNKVWLQYPKPTKFSKKECDFGGVKLGKKYTKEEINEIFYKNKEEMGKSVLVGKAKDRFVQKTTDVLNDKLKLLETDDLAEYVGVDGEYELVCFSDGVAYFLQDGKVAGELIVGDGVYNRSYCCKEGGELLVKAIYSEPKKKTQTKIEFDELGEELFKLIGLEEITKYSGTDLVFYEYSANGANMNACFDGDGNTIFIAVYE